MTPASDVLLTAALSIFLFLVLCAALVLLVISMRRPTTPPLMVAAILVVAALVVVAIAPVNIPAIMGLILAVLGVTAAAVGGNPVTRRVLEIATGGRVRETEDGGIVVVADAGAPAGAAGRGDADGQGDADAGVPANVAGQGDADAAGPGGARAEQPGGTHAAARTLMRGGTVIGYLERVAVVLAVLAGYPAAIAVVVAVKGIGRFPELAAAEARERFIIGTLASLLWAGAVGALLRLAIW